LDRISWNVFFTGNNFIQQLFSVKEERKGNAFDYGAEGALDRISWNAFSTGNNFIHQLFSVKEERNGKAFVCGAFGAFGSDIMERIFYRK
jgi:hypothetical protein